MDNKVTVISREGKAEIFTGSAFHVLNDASSTQFKTNVISVFSEYLKDKKVENVFYSTTKLEAFNITDSGVECIRNIEPVAKCELEFSDQLSAVTRLNHNKFSADAIERAILSLEKYCDTSAVDLLKLVQNVSVQKVIDIQRKKDNSGNFMHSISISGGKKEDVEYPSQIAFTVPVYKCHSFDLMRITYACMFNYDIKKDDNGPTVNLSWALDNFALDEEIKETQEGVICRYLKMLDCKKWRGNFSVIKKDDSWKYLGNPAK